MTQSEESGCFSCEYSPVVVMTQSEESGCFSCEYSPVKIMEKGSHVLVVDNFPGRIDAIGMGKSIESIRFVVGGFGFRIQLYPNGVNADANRSGYVSMFIKNESPKAAEVVYGLEILDRMDEDLPYGHSSFDVRNTYHQVDTLLPGSVLGYFDYITHSSIPKYYGPNHSILIRATIGVVCDHDQLPIAKSSPSFERHPGIVFQVGDLRFFEKESMISTRCPALISDYPQFNNTVLISDVDPDVFKAVLWFLNNNSIHLLLDVPAITNTNGLFAFKMLAAAQKLRLKYLKVIICDYLVLYGNLHVLYRYSGIDHSVKELWRKVSSWVPRKMKAA